MFEWMARVWGAAAVVFGLAGAAVPRRVIDVAERLVLVGYENPEELEPSEWYVAAVRAKFGLVAVTGAVVLALEYADFGDGDANGPENPEATDA
ncbi:hypothetical protein [Halobellus ruber]|uniref:DUF6199 domain-containing protein n=1 Tax=Halobellus ruber TaxID=2761102 RepID=A0A7J9SGC7_9EURY|nr:hypothetical protein [Halobellus ruber]MBB6645179.1 hypothetical protein [Halobellus ruber]